MSINARLKKDILNFLTNKFARKLKQYEVKFANTLLDSMTQADLNNLCASVNSQTEIADILATVLYENMSQLVATNVKKTAAPEFDMREYTTAQLLNESSLTNIAAPQADAAQADNKQRVTPISIKNLLGMVNKIDLRSVFNPAPNIIKDFIIFDTRYRNVNLGNNNQFQWGYSDTIYVKPGAVNTQYTIRNLIGMRALQFVFPKTGYYGQTFLNVNTGRVSLFIREFQRQAFVAQAQSYYHMIFRTVPDISLSPAMPASAFICYAQTQIEDYRDGMITFRPPITEVNSFTFQFQDPINVLNFPPDRDYVSFTYGNPTTITSVLPNNLITGSRVFFTNFTTSAAADPIDAALIAAINDPNGLVITVAAPSTTNTVFTIPVDTTAIVGPIVGLSIECYYAQWRIIIPFELFYLK